MRWFYGNRWKSGVGEKALVSVSAAGILYHLMLNWWKTEAPMSCMTLGSQLIMLLPIIMWRNYCSLAKLP